MVEHLICIDPCDSKEVAITSFQLVPFHRSRDGGQPRWQPQVANLSSFSMCKKASNISRPTVSSYKVTVGFFFWIEKEVSLCGERITSKLLLAFSPVFSAYMKRLGSMRMTMVSGIELKHFFF